MTTTRSTTPPALTRRTLFRGALGIAATAGASSLLAGCGSDTPTAGGSGGASGELLFWHNYTQDSRVTFMQEAAKAFEKAHPGTTVKIEVVPNPQFTTKWPAAQAANSLPDVTTILPENAVAMQLAGALNPMDDVLADLGGSEAFSPGLIDKLGTYKDTVILLPHYVHNRLLINRKDMLTEADISLPEKPTWDEAYQAAVALQSPPDHNGWILNLAKADVGGSYTLWTLTRSTGGKFFDADGTAMLDTPEVRRATDYLLRIARDAGNPAQINYTIADNFNLVTSGKTALSLGAGAEIGNAVQEAPEVADQLTSTFLPRDKESANLLGAFSFALPKGRNPSLAKEFVKFMYSEDMYVPFLHTIPLFMFPALAAADSPTFYEQETIKKFETTAKQTLVGVKEGDAPGFEDGPNPYAGATFGSHIVDEAIQSMLVADVDPGTALKAANGELQTLLDGIRSRAGN